MARPLGVVARAAARLYRREPLGAWFGTAWVALLLLRAHLTFIRNPQGLNVDEGYIVAFGKRMLDGQLLPYVDAVSHRGPMVYWAGAIVAMFGSTSWLPLRLASALAFIGVALLTFLGGRRAGQPLAGAVGALACAYGSLIILAPMDGIAFNGEVVLDLFVMASFLCLAHGLMTGDRPPSVRWVAAAGVLAMLGMLSKQVGATIFVPFGLWVLAAAGGHPGLRGGQRWRLVAAFVLGAVAPLALVLLRYAVVGELETFWYYFITYNFDVYMLPFKGVSRLEAINRWLVDNLLLAILALGAVGWGLGRVAMAWTGGGLRALPAAYHAAGFQVTVCLSAVASLLGAQLAMRGFGHYFVQAIPWFGLLAGMVAEPWASAGRGPQVPSRPGARLAYHLLVLVPMLVMLEAAFAPRQRGRGGPPAQPPPICVAIQANSRPDQAIFVWGFWADLHVWCKRKPASRFVFSTFVAGLIPWFLDQSREMDEARAVPGSRDQLIQDLEKSQAAVIVDAYRGLGMRQLRRYPKLAAYLDEHYRWVSRVEGADIYVRGKSRRRRLFDFEKPTLVADGWTVTGESFLATDVTTHPPQGPITGQDGKRFVNSFPERGWDSVTGSAESPVFTIDRRYLGFLIGGGTRCKVSLRIDGKTVLEASGYDAADVSDYVWDVSDYKGKQAQLVLTDGATGPWGHLLLDRVELFDGGQEAAPR
jgi:4-amino-4-deoxy-L-arabinose transferase-like glycosyltransferase